MTWVAAVAEGPDRAYLNGMEKTVSFGVPQERRMSHLALMVAAAAAGLVLASTLALWAHYGTLVFYEMIASGIAACF